MKKLGKRISVFVILAMLVGMLGGVVSASAAGSIWSFSVAKKNKTAAVGETIEMKPNEFAAFELNKKGKQVTASEYTVTWKSDNEKVLWIDKKNGKARAAKGVQKDELFGLYGKKAKVSATFTNVKTGKSATRSFYVKLVATGELFSAEEKLNITEILTGENFEYIASAGGIVVAKKDGAYGAMNKKGEIVVPFEYPYGELNPNGEGQFALSKLENGVSVTDCFDAKGNLLYTIKNAVAVYMSEGYVSYICFKGIPKSIEEEINTYAEIYDIKNKKVIPVSDLLRFEDDKVPYIINPLYISPIVDGKCIVTGNLFDLSATGSCVFDVNTMEWQEIAPVFDNRAFNVNASKVVGCWTCPDPNQTSGYTESLGLYSLEEKTLVMVPCDSVMEAVGYPEAFFYVMYDFYDGYYVENIKDRVTIEIIAEDTAVSYVLLDFSKAKSLVKATEYFGSEYSGADNVYVVTNPSEIIVAQYDWIETCQDGLYMIQDKDRWGFMNKDGKQLAMFDDSASFAGDYALAVEDGKLYVIDRNMNRYETDIKTDAVVNRLQLLSYENGNQVTYLEITEK